MIFLKDTTELRVQIERSKLFHRFGVYSSHYFSDGYVESQKELYLWIYRSSLVNMELLWWKEFKGNFMVIWSDNLVFSVAKIKLK